MSDRRRRGRGNIPRDGVDSPLINPNAGDVTNNTQDSVNGGSGTQIRTTAGVLTGEYKYGNYSGFSNMPQTGNRNLYPSSVKNTRQKVINPSKYGFQIPLTDTQFVNATTVRSTGGKLTQFSGANQLTVVPREPRPLRVETTINEPFSRVLPSDIGRTYRNVYYDPLSVGTSFGSGGRRIQNRRNGTLSATPIGTENTINATNNIDDRFGGRANRAINNRITEGMRSGTALIRGNSSEVPVGVDPTLRDARVFSPAEGEAVTLPTNLQPVDNTIVFADIPPMTITPVDANGDPAGPPATITVRNATPRVEISTADFAGVEDGSELYIAGTKVVIKGQDPIPSLANQLSENSLLNSYVGIDENGEPKLIIESCQNNPFAIANGCAGGELRQVGDFHVNKGFEQSKQLTSTYIPASGENGEITVFVPTVDSSRDAEAENTSNFAKTGRLVDLDFNLRDYNLNWDASKGNGGDPDIVTEIETTLKTPSFFPQETIIQSRAGVGYRKGDRLRLVGGTPVNSNKGPLTRIIIEDSGIGYVNPADISVIIGDGTTPGVGAAAEVISLNAAGGIQEIRILNYGVGYDPSRPPKISFQDNAPGIRRSTVNTSQYNQNTRVLLNPRQVVKHRVETVVNYQPGISQVTLEVLDQYYRVSDLLPSPIEVGGQRQTEALEIRHARNEQNHTPYELDIQLPGDFVVQPGSYIKLVAVDDSAPLTGSNTVNQLPQLLVVQRSGGVITVHSEALAKQTVADAVLDRMSLADDLNPITVTAAIPFPVEFLSNSMIAVVNPNLGQRDAAARAIIGLAPDADINDVGNSDYQNPFYGAKDEQGYAALSGPLRVAKFLVTDVDDEGAITALKILDRGLYRVFPSDLTLGIPLEYDYEPLGVPSSVGSGGVTGATTLPNRQSPVAPTPPAPPVAPTVADIPQQTSVYGTGAAIPAQFIEYHNPTDTDGILNAYTSTPQWDNGEDFLTLNAGKVHVWPMTVIPDSQGTWAGEFFHDGRISYLDAVNGDGIDRHLITWFSNTPAGPPLAFTSTYDALINSALSDDWRYENRPSGQQQSYLTTNLDSLGSLYPAWSTNGVGGVVYLNIMVGDIDRVVINGDFSTATFSDFIPIHNIPDWWVPGTGVLLNESVAIGRPRWRVIDEFSLTEQALLDAGIGRSSPTPAASNAAITVIAASDNPIPSGCVAAPSWVACRSANAFNPYVTRIGSANTTDWQIPTSGDVVSIPFNTTYSREAAGFIRISNASSNVPGDVILAVWFSETPGGEALMAYGGRRGAPAGETNPPVPGVITSNSTGVGVQVDWTQNPNWATEGGGVYLGSEGGIRYINYALLDRTIPGYNGSQLVEARMAGVENYLYTSGSAPWVGSSFSPRVRVPLETGTVYGVGPQSVNNSGVDVSVLDTLIDAAQASPPNNVIVQRTAHFNTALEDGTISSYGPRYGGSVGNSKGDWLPVASGTISAIPISFRAGLGVGAEMSLRSINMNVGFFTTWFSDVPGDWDGAYTFDQNGTPTRYSIPAEGYFRFTQNFDSQFGPRFADDENKLIWLNVCQLTADPSTITTAILQSANPPLREFDGGEVLWNLESAVRFYDSNGNVLRDFTGKDLTTQITTSPGATNTVNNATSAGFVRSNDTLGGVDPLRNNILYGGTHPEYFRDGQVTDPALFNTIIGNTSAGAKHRDWADFIEFKIVNGNRVDYYGTPGAYDPSTYVADANGQPLAKTNELVFDQQRGFRYKEPLRLGGGRGARVFLTADIVPDCSSRGRAREQLGLPDVVTEVNVPQTFVDAFNQGLTDVGYLPEDILWEVLEPDSPIPQVNLITNFPGVKFDGFDWFGIPDGVYNNDILCLVATLKDRDLTETQFEDQIEQLFQGDGFGVIQQTGVIRPTVDTAVPNTINQQRYTNTAISLLCVDAIKSDPNSVFGGGTNNINVVRELYQYDLTDIFGGEFQLNNDQLKQDVDVFYFHSQRYQDSEQYQQATSTNLDQASENLRGLSLPHSDIKRPEQAWIDSYTMEESDAFIQARYPGFVNGGWVYLEDGEIRRWQTPLVDTKFIHNALIYDPATGNKSVDLDFWDPFKGILPGFIRKEIKYISITDPVSVNSNNNPEGQYDLDRSGFGREQVGQLWWDTSTIRYNWYEQGSNRERWENWGSAFPGSIVTISEWVESQARPQNYSGDGVVKYTSPYRYIKERHFDANTQEYVTYYYYWVQNRTVLDPRLVEKLGRQWDARTIARYIADPVNYGIPMISFLNDNSVMFSNITDSIRTDASHVQVNLSRDLDPNGIKHTSWKLLREGDQDSRVPDQMIIKMIDSLAGENAIGQVVPDPGLSEVQKYGIQYRPRQSAFRDVKQAREIMAYVINQALADINLYTQYPDWDRAMPLETQWTYIQRVTWYAVDRVDEQTGEKIRFDDSYKPVFNVDNVSDLRGLIDLPDGTVVQVGAANAPQRQLWLYRAQKAEFDRIAITGDTVRFSDLVYTDENNSVMSLEIRSMLTVLNSGPLANLNIWNQLFFELLKYAYMEQGQLDWAFKTTYLYVDKNEQDLIQIPGFKPDTFDSILEYMNEVKPYNAKIREYKDGKSPPIETIGVIKSTDLPAGSGDCVNAIPCLPGIPGEDLSDCNTSAPVNPNAGLRSISDYDKPPYVDTTNGGIRVLNERDPLDQVILSTDPDYVNYTRVGFKGQDPIRRANVTIHWDRTNWQLTQFNWNAATTTVFQSIAENIADLMSQQPHSLSNTDTYRAADRIFRLDTQVQEQFVRDLRNYFEVFNNQTDYQQGDFVRWPGADVIFDLYQVVNTISPPKAFGQALADGDLVLLEEPYNEVYTDITLLTEIVQSGGLNFTLALVKSKVGGDYQGEWLDADLFSRLVIGNDDYFDYEQILGYDTLNFDTFFWDIVDRVNNYVGIFREPPMVNLRRNDRDADGFDSHTFLRTLYGEERPEELVYVDPYESLIINVYTDVGSNTVLSANSITLDANGSITSVTLPEDFAQRSYGSVQTTVFVEDPLTGANASITASTQDLRIVDLVVNDGGNGYGANTTITVRSELNNEARPVEYQMVYGLFGNTDYVRVRNKTTLLEDVRPWSEHIVVADASNLLDPTPDVPGLIWLDRELIRYDRKVGNTLSVLQRGQMGTTITDHLASDTVVYPGDVNEQFNQLDPERAIWLEIGARYDQLYDFDDPDYNSLPPAPPEPGFDYDAGNVITITDNIPFDYANISGQTALSLADRANADPRARDSIMKFLHNLPTAFDDPPGFNP